MAKSLGLKSYSHQEKGKSAEVRTEKQMRKKRA